mgnify:CR=1 FL=1
MRLIGIAGWKNAGKTTLAEGLVRELTRRGLRVATLKHAHHAADTDREGTDSHRHRLAGATETILATPARWALMHELRGGPEPSLDALLARLSPCDWAVAEGWKSHPHPKIWVHRAATGHPPPDPADATIRAVATDAPLPGAAIPLLPLSDPSAVADWLLAGGAR